MYCSNKPENIKLYIWPLILKQCNFFRIFFIFYFLLKYMSFDKKKSLFEHIKINMTNP